MPIIKQCLVCEKEFETYPSRIKRGKGKYCSKECCLKVTAIEKGQRLSPETEFKKGHIPHNAKGWRYTQSREGSPVYKELHMPEHPDSNANGYIREHRLVMEEELGRRLKENEVVHHINGDGLDNRVENLQVMNKIDHDRMNTPLNIHKRWND